MEISKQSFRQLNENRDIRLTRQEVLKADSDGDGQLSTTEAEKAKIAVQDLPALNQALQASAAMEPSTVLFAMSGKSKSMPAQIPAVQRIQASSEALQSWRAESKQIKAGANTGTEAERREATAKAVESIVSDGVQWSGNDKNEFKQSIACPYGPFLSYVRAGLIDTEQAKHLMGNSPEADAIPDPKGSSRLLLETLGIEAGKPIPPERVYKGPHQEPTPKAGDVAVFVEKDAQGNPTTSASHFATFTGNGWEVMSLQRHTSPPNPDNPAIKTTIEDIWAGDFGNTAVVICPFPFQDP